MKKQIFTVSLIFTLAILLCGYEAKTITVNGEKIGNNFESLVIKAELLFADGDYEEAIICYTAAIKNRTA